MRMIKLNKIDYHTFEEGQDLEPEVRTVPVLVNAEAIRCFYPRKQNRPGTRITFTDGGGFAVAETPEQLAEAVTCLGAVIHVPAVLPTPEQAIGAVN